MSLDHAFDLWDWTTVIGLVAVGIGIGFVLLPYAWPIRQEAGMEYPAIMAGILAAAMFGTFFVFLIAFRYLTIDPAVASRTWGTAAEGIVFALSSGLGLHLRARR